ncbi:hypothetical protein N7G274_009610 [Stereocaulon virgatum]|uniref:Uncharacterized protein n=1 Tax=Stereocaulon virgatum TaxID=373712 RepID=A0ABR3ZY34_9LECA
MAAHSPPSPRRFLPQPIEEMTRSNRASPIKDRLADGTGHKPHRELPQPVETSSTHSKPPATAETSLEHAPIAITSSQDTLPQPMDSSTPSPKPRRFAPQMIETSRRRRKSTDTTPCVTPTDKTDYTPGPQNHLPKHMRQQRPTATPVPPDNSPVVSSDTIPQLPESKFSSSKLAERAQRQHSFRIPDLPPITSQSETEESNDSSVPSLSTSPSAESDQTESASKKKKGKRKSGPPTQSEDARWSGYMLQLAATTAEKQLRDQAMAAYPNEHMHEPVDHYAFDRDSEESDVEVGVGKLQVGGAAEEDADRRPTGYRHRDSDAGFGLVEMRKHQQKLEDQKRDQWAQAPSEFGRRRSTRSALQQAKGHQKTAEAGVPGAPAVPPKEVIGWQKDNEMKPMRNAASPPMAGEDLKFTKCLSPQPTRLDVHSYSGKQKSTDAESRQHTGLWTPGGGASRQSSKSGLWNGVCHAANQDTLAMPRPTQTGLLTPAVERQDPFELTSGYGDTQLPPSPPNSQEECTRLDSVLRRERSIDRELGDNFVTQVYNYLSLGYPSLARKFDSELSKITRVPIEDLRKDDDKCNAKGYVGAPEGTGVDCRSVLEGDTKCERWCALRLYVREWGRQQPEMGAVEDTEGGWGARARRGSWAI